MGRNVTGSRRGFGWDAQNQRLALYVNGQSVDYFDVPNFKTYYVNNVTGGATNDGLSWGQAFDQFSTAITAVTAAHTAEAAVASTDQYRRHRIIIQGTGTMYSAVSDLPSYCDVIGLGATPFGDGSGIVKVGDNAGAADGIAGSARGLTLYNMQFVGEGSYYAADFAILYRSSIEDCSFGGDSSTSEMAVGLNIVSGSGVVIRRCRTVGHAAPPVIGFQFASAGGNFNECLVEDCFIMAKTTGWSNVAYLQNNSVYRNNIVYGGTSGILDTSTETTRLGNGMYTLNFGSGGTTGMSVTNNPESRALNNWEISSSTSALYYAYGA